MRRAFLILTLMLARVAAGASEPGPASAFAEANKAYELGQFGPAARQYEALVASNTVSHAVWFNLGNAYFRLDQKGAAIHAYLKAAHIAPRDADTQANLAFARDKAPGASASVFAPSRPLLIPFVAAGELKFAILAAVWIWFLSFLLRWVKPEWGPKTSGWERLAGTLALALAGIGLASHLWANGGTAIVSTPEAAVRFGPLEESQSQFTLRDGAELKLLSTREEWMEVEDRSGKRGWVAASDVRLIP